MERYDRGRQSSLSYIRANLRIRVPRIRCIDEKGEMIGVLATRDARAMAEQRGLDLVEISPNADPPVCRIMDFGKFRYEESRRQRQARRHQHAHQLKEVKFHANVAEHDYQTKLGHLREFLQKGNKVKLTLTFRGRENAHRDLGFNLVNRVVKDCEDIGQVDMSPRLMGRSLVSMLSARSSKHGTTSSVRPAEDRPAAPGPGAGGMAPRPSPVPSVAAAFATAQRAAPPPPPAAPPAAAPVAPAPDPVAAAPQKALDAGAGPG